MIKLNSDFLLHLKAFDCLLAKEGSRFESDCVLISIDSITNEINLLATNGRLLTVKKFNVFSDFDVVACFSKKTIKSMPKPNKKTRVSIALEGLTLDGVLYQFDELPTFNDIGFQSSLGMFKVFESGYVRSKGLSDVGIPLNFAALLYKISMTDKSVFRFYSSEKPIHIKSVTGFCVIESLLIPCNI